MKRPPSFYLVVVWSFIAMHIQSSYLARPALALRAADKPAPLLWTLLPVIAFVFIVWQTVELVRLKPFNRWFAVGFFVWWAFTLSWNFMVNLSRPGFKVIPATLIFSALIAVNLLSAWYLW